MQSRVVARIAAGLGVVVVALSMPAMAATLTWDGGGVDNLWSTGANWSPGSPVPINGDILQFAGIVKLSNFNNVVGQSYGRVSFLAGAGGFKLGGNSFTSTGNITNASGNLQQIGSAITVSSAQTWSTTSTGDLSVNGVAIGDGLTLQLNAASGTTIDVNGPVSGATGGISTAGPGIIDLQGGTNTYGGGTTISGGTLRISSDANLGAAGGGLTFSDVGTLATMSSNRAIILNATSLFDVAGGTTLTSTGSVTGSGQLFKSGGGTLVLAGFTSYSGGTVITGGGTVQGNSNTLQGNFNGAGNVVFDQASNGIYSSTSRIQDSIHLVKQNAGTLTLGGTNTYGGGTTISGGTLRISSDANLGAAGGGLTFNGGGTLATTATMSSNRTIQLNGTSFFDVAGGTTPTSTGSVFGSGLLFKNGGGTLVLAGFASYSGGTVITGGGTVQGNSNTLQGNFQGVGNVVFDQASNGIYFATSDDNIEDGIHLVKQNAGTLTLSGNNSYSGGTTITGGKLKGSAGSFGFGNIVNNAALEFEQGSDGAFNLGISGTGSVTKTAGGTLTLRGTNTYSGETNIDGGTVALDGNGSIADSSKVTVGATAMLDVSGVTRDSILNGDVVNHGTIAGGINGFTLELAGDVSGGGDFVNSVLFSGLYGPGNSPALVNHGDTSFGPLSQLNLEIGGLLRGTEYDAIDAISLNLDGALKVSLIDLGFGDFVPQIGNTFDLLVANTISGMFSSFDFTAAVLSSGLRWDYRTIDLGSAFAFQLFVAANDNSGGGDGVPAPATIIILAIGLGGLGVIRRRHKAA